MYRAPAYFAAIVLLLCACFTGRALSQDAPAADKQEGKRKDGGLPKKKGNGKKSDPKNGDGKPAAAGTDQAKPAPPPASGEIQFLDLAAPQDNKKPELPYGQEFTIKGNTKDICIGGDPIRGESGTTCAKGGVLVSSLIDATDVNVEYTGNGKSSAKVNGGQWSVKINKLEPNTPVSFKFTFSGKLSVISSGQVLDALFASQKFQDAFSQFTKAATGKSAADAAPLAAAFGALAAQQVLDAVSATTHATPTNADAFRKTLSGATFTTFAPFYNLVSAVQDLSAADRARLGITDSMKLTEIHQKLADALKAGIKTPAGAPDAALTKQLTSILANYDAVITQFQIEVSANLTVAVDADAADITADLKKYAGFDMGALYSPRLHELRSFATVNIYLGPVSLHPEKGTRSPLLERLSLTFGMALKDISGGDADKTKIKGDNAFIYGVGVRLNKYFRITTGGMVYRTKLPDVNGVSSPISNKLRHEFYIGPSIDITAIPALEGIFGKKQSN